MLDSNSLFGLLKIPPGDFRMFSFPQFSLAIKREKEGWIFLRMEKHPHGEAPDFSGGEYFQTGKSDALLLIPSMPPRPVVFNGSRLFISPRQKLTFFLKIPLMVKACFAKNSPENVLKEIEIEPLSNTWFGEPDSGEPACSLGEQFYYHAHEARLLPWEALCPVTIFNNWTGVLKMERLIIRTENLLFYKNNEKMITSMVALEYKGKDITSSAEYRYSRAIHGEEAEMVAKAVRKQEKNRLKINFHFIKNIYK